MVSTGGELNLALLKNIKKRIGIPPNPNGAKENPNIKFFPNLVKTLSPERVKKIGSELKAGFDSDFLSMREKLERLTQINELYAMLVEPKNEPWEGAANMKGPQLNSVISNHEARLVNSLFNELRPIHASKSHSFERTIAGLYSLGIYSFSIKRR